MARGTFSVSNYLSRTDSTITVEPITLACWFYAVNVASQQCLMSLNRTDGTDHCFHLRYRPGASGKPVSAVKLGAANGIADKTGITTAGAWYHCAAVFASTTSRKAYLNGVAGSADTTSVDAISADNQGIGIRQFSAGAGLPCLGYLAEAAIWNVALTDAEIVSLSCGVSPLNIKRANLVRYWPLYAGDANGAEADYSGNGATLTETGTVGTSAHPAMMPDGAFADDYGTVISDGVTGQKNLHAIMGDNLED